MRRDAAIPHEPFIEMRIQTSEDAEEDGCVCVCVYVCVCVLY